MALSRSSTMTLPRSSTLLVQRERSDDPADSAPATFSIITHPFFNTMFCTRMPVPRMLRLNDTTDLYVDSPLSMWMDRIEGYTRDTTGRMRYNAHPDFTSMLNRLKNIVAVLVVACAEQNHRRIHKEIQGVLDVLCWTKYFMTKQRFMFPIDDDGDYDNKYIRDTPPLVAFWRYEDMQKVSETTAAPGSIKGVINSMFESQMATGTLEDCEAVYDHILSRLASWDKADNNNNLPLSLFCYGMQVTFYRALHYLFPTIIGTDDMRETLSKHWSCTLHREIECLLQKRLMMVNQVDPEQLDTIAKRLCKSDRKLRVVSQTYVPELFKGCHTIGLMTTKLDVLPPNHGLAKSKKDTVVEQRRIPYQPKFYSACVYWRLLAELWHPDTPVIHADWCTDTRIYVLEAIATKAVQKSQVHGKSVSTVDKAAEPAVVRNVQRLTAKQMRDEQEEKLRIAQRRVKARIENKLHAALERQRRREIAEAYGVDDDEGDDGDAVAALFPSFSATEPSKEKKQATATAASEPAKGKRKRAPRHWTNSKSDYHQQCLQLIQQLKFDVVQCLAYYARIVLMCNSGSCHVEPPLNAETPQEPAMANPENMPLQTHKRKQRRTFSETSVKKEEEEKAKKTAPIKTKAKKTKAAAAEEDVSVVNKPSPTGPIRSFILRLFQTTVNDPVWREPILSHKDVATALVLCRDRKTKQFQWAFSVPRDLHRHFSLRFRQLPPDLPLSTNPKAYEALNPKSGFGDRLFQKVLDGYGGADMWGPWRVAICTREYVHALKEDKERYIFHRLSHDYYCVVPRYDGPDLNNMEFCLLASEQTFKRLAKRDLITWFMVLRILYRDPDVAYQELRLVRPTVTPWVLERAFVQYDLAMRSADPMKDKDTKDAQFAWVRAMQQEWKDWQLLDFVFVPEKHGGRPTSLVAAFDAAKAALRDLDLELENATSVHLGDTQERVDDLRVQVENLQQELEYRQKDIS